MSVQNVPVTCAPNQQYAVPLTVDGNSLTLILGVHYNEVSHYWVMTIWDQNYNLLLDSIPMITGNWPACNLLRQYPYLAIGSAYVINVSGTPGGIPDNTNLGTAYELWWGDTPGIA